MFWQWMGLAVAAAVLCMVVRAQQPQMASLCALAAGAMLLLSALESASTVQTVFARLTVLGGLQEGYLGTLLKVLGVSFAAELAAQTCQDMGEGGLSLKVNLAGKLCVFALTAPMLLSLLEMILELVP
ncbi:MAG: SpoIIIAC/SpoIIIAD family protein [Clostridia bacterium]